MMKRLIYQVYVGDFVKKSNLYDTCIESVARYCKEHEIDHYVQRTAMLRIKPDPLTSNRPPASHVKFGGYMPIFEKENALGKLIDYDQVCVVDADIYIREDAPNIFEDVSTDFDMCSVFESEMPLNQWYKAKHIDYCQKLLTPFKQYDWNFNNGFGGSFFNSGLIVYNSERIIPFFRGETPAEFLSRDYFKDFIDGIGWLRWQGDQIMLNYWTKREGITVQHLDWKWNALFRGIEDSRIPEAHSVHFYMRERLPNLGENIQELLELIGK